MPEREVINRDLSRFLAKVDVRVDGCWEWNGATRSSTYGAFAYGGRRKVVQAHRWSYEHFVGPVPEGMQIDHLCRNRACVRPDHLEPVTPRENTRRGTVGEVNRRRLAAVTHCPAGHEYTAENTYRPPNSPHTRHRRACKAERQRRAA